MMETETFGRVVSRRQSHSTKEDNEENLKFLKKPVNFIRLGRSRQNRPLIMSHVNKRLKSFGKDYRLFLYTTCRSLQITKEEISEFRKSELANLIGELIQQNNQDFNAYLSLHNPNINNVCFPFPILILHLIQSFHDIKQIASQPSYLSLDLAEKLDETCKILNSSPLIFVDQHAPQIIAWWIPQQIEILSALLLLSNTTPDGNTQSLETGKEIFFLFIEEYEKNLVIVVYLLMGGYLSTSELLPVITNNESSEREASLLNSMRGKMDTVTKLIRESVQPTADLQTGCRYLNNRQSSFYGLEESSLSDESTTWRSIGSKIPRTFNSSNYLFSLSIPGEMRILLGLDASAPRVVDMSALSLMERIGSIAGSLECMRENWPSRFDEVTKRWLLRNIVFVHKESANLKEVNDVSFMAPEAWEAITLFLEMLEEFVFLLVLLVQREASQTEAENYIGEVIVYIRFLNAINKIDN